MKILIVYACCLIVSGITHAQSLQLPTEVVYYKPRPKEDPAKNGGYYTVTTAFHPIGWSKDGKFAYAMTYDGYVDGLCVKVVIQDMVSDKIIWTEESCVGEGNKGDINTIWAKISPKAEKALATHKIIPEKKVDYRKESWHRINGQPYKFEVIKKDKLTVVCRAQGLGGKTLHSGTTEEVEYQFIYAASEYYVSGIIKSPYEDRVVVVYHLLSKGFEFAKDEEFGLTGCHLKTGFK